MSAIKPRLTSKQLGWFASVHTLSILGTLAIMALTLPSLLTGMLLFFTLCSLAAEVTLFLSHAGDTYFTLGGHVEFAEWSNDTLVVFYIIAMCAGLLIWPLFTPLLARESRKFNKLRRAIKLAQLMSGNGEQPSRMLSDEKCNCGKPIPTDAQHCPSCGRAAFRPEPTTLVVCPKCGLIGKEEDRYCQQCGHRVEREAIVVKDKNVKERESRYLY